MGKRKNENLGWSWRPDASTQAALANKWAGEQKRKRARKRNKRRKKNALFYAPGEVFYESKPWKRLRQAVFHQYGRKCMKCDAVDVELHVDHIKPRSKFPELSLTFSNLQVLCRACNMAKWNYHSTDYRDESAMRDFELRLALEARRIL